MPGFNASRTSPACELLADNAIDSTPTSGWAAQLLLDVGGARTTGDATTRADETSERAHLDWARSGAMALTGRADGPPVFAPAAFATATAGAVRALSALCLYPTGQKSLEALDAPALLGEHGAAGGLERDGTTSAGGQCRILPTSDGHIALQLAREDDVELLEAWLEVPRLGEAHWAFTQREVRNRSSALCVERARLLGLPCVDAQSTPETTGEWLRLHRIARPGTRAQATPPLVVDLSALWAGPLAAHLLGISGAKVIKVESTRRPDGARRGPAAFYNAVNAAKHSVALDFDSREGIAALHRLIHAADIVIEASRPRALAQLGIDVHAAIAAHPGKTWLSITGYGRDDPFGNWVAFGDDAAIAAGTSAALHAQEGEWLFCGDALADPVTGSHAAFAAMASHRAGGGNLLELSLCGVTGSVLHRTGSLPSARVRRTREDSYEIDRPEAASVRVEAPRLRNDLGQTAALGADTNSILESIA